jgi:uncharacterized membrane protein YhaH (DUF805 family)
MQEIQFLEAMIATGWAVLSLILLCMLILMKHFNGKSWLLAANSCWSIAHSYIAALTLIQLGSYDPADYFYTGHSLFFYAIYDFSPIFLMLFFLALWSKQHIKGDIKQHLFSFKGRSPRSLYWAISGLLIASTFVLVKSAYLTGAGRGGYSILHLLFLIAVCAVLICHIWIGLVISVRRWHDCNQSGWLALIYIIPIIGGIIALIMQGGFKGTVGNNSYGPSPLLKSKETIKNAPSI